MKSLIKPPKLGFGDTIAAVSPSNGWAGDAKIQWRYRLGVKRLEELGLQVLAAPNSLRGSEYLSKNPQARAEDLMWAFENKRVNAVICNVGGNDSIRVIPYIDAACIRKNPKIFVGYSDVMNIHLLCYQNGLSSFYGDNLLSAVAEPQCWHTYSKYWFWKVLFDSSVIGTVEPSAEWTYESTDYMNPNAVRAYYPNQGYSLIQGSGRVTGRLFGGHTGLMELDDTPLRLSTDDFQDRILFIEDIPAFFTRQKVSEFFEWLGKIGALHKLNGIVIGKANEKTEFNEQKARIRQIISHEYGL